MAKIGIFVGTVYGAAQGLAQEFEAQLAQEGHDVCVYDSTPQYDEFMLYQHDVALIVTSTTGQGELPGELVPLYEGLRAQFPILTSMHYAIAALGDSSYGEERYCGGGRQFDALLLELSATPLCERVDIDACETFDPEEAGLPWLQQVIAQLKVLS
ncbi:flavodoxin [Thaumasiovibrio sp. DFM-14]|uniref:flavodoxin n=1 Tax=Thaumasiovibrio sp. DFM-14 TaxID=3384792 RepID=UPI0039A23DD1